MRVAKELIYLQVIKINLMRVSLGRTGIVDENIFIQQSNENKKEFYVLIVLRTLTFC